MFTFIHTADIHLDSPLRGLSQHSEAPVEQIRGATRRALENIVDLALERQVDFVVISGDLYDGDWPDFSTGQFFNHEMRRLEAANILVYLISGNHDAASKITKTLRLPENVMRFSTKKPESSCHPDLPVTLHGQGFANQSVPENLALEYPAPIPERFNIGILHTSLTGSNPEHDPYAPCSVSDLTEKGYHYWALGHIHMHEVVQESPAIIFPGNPQGRHIKETDERGCYLISVDDDLVISDTEFIATDVVRWSSPEIDVTDFTELDEVLDSIRATTQSLLSEINQSERLQLAAFRLTLTGSTELHGQLHSTHRAFQAECLEIALELDSDTLWLEQVKIKTTPIIDLDELATRDALSARVIDALGRFDPSASLSKNQAKLKDKLGGIAPQELDSLFTPESDEDKQQLSEEVAAIVLHSISHSAH